ncbi:depupylase/deamidase Dop [Agilicoccus flavus]|uniref:depupylase/deamidase Dop n=1 Tax=Agilicoccus flavus TaxID=2775968 RepID=UPI001CF62170|nr:depupylase/deamidase Dop [Agilicoccus flavus]
MEPTRPPVSVARVMGVETEYGISVPGKPHANPMVGSGRVVQAYARTAGGTRVRWDYAGEAPMSDARGFDLDRDRAHPSQLTDEWEDDPMVANVVLTNGARLYVDHAHPEYSSPEVASPREAIVWDRAGEIVMARAAAALAEQATDEGGGEVPDLYKNNTDGKGASYGTHENYLVPRETPFGDLVAGLLPFFAVRQILCGAGRVGIGPESQLAGYQISSRADFMEAEVGLETTFRRPIVNTRDEPHAVAKRYRRLHVIVGDANLCDVAALLKTGTTSLVLAAIERGRAPSLALADPVRAIRTVSHDPTLRARVDLADGRSMTGLDVLEAYHEAVAAMLEEGGAGEGAGGADADTRQVMTLWAQTMADLRRDVASCADRIDWVAKLALAQRYRDRDDLAWDDARLRAVDIQFSDVRPGKGLARTLEAKGRLRRLVADDEIARAVTHAPESTRAWFRGECVRRYGPEVVAASWESVVLAPAGTSARQWVGTPEPLRGTRSLAGDLLDACPDAASLVAALTAG